MWPICYEDLNKLHMSIGMGLLVASFILILMSTLFFFDNLNIVIDESREDYLFITNMEGQTGEAKDTLLKQYDNLRIVQITKINEIYKVVSIGSIGLGIIGSILFFIGYFHFRSDFLKKWKND